MTHLPLRGVRIIDLTRIWAGPHATQLLAFLGAEVIKVESTTYMDIGRFLFISEDQLTERPCDHGGYFHIFNMNKYGTTLDLRTERGKKIFEAMVQVSDVVIDNYTPRVMKNFGFDYPTLKKVRPDIIMVSMPGYGSTGPYRDLMAYGESIEPNSGISSLTGYDDGPPMRSGIAYGDPIAGYNAAIAILIALHYRRRTGKGQYVDVAHMEGLTRLIGEAIVDYTMNGRVRRRIGNLHTSMAPHGAYPCRGDDMWVAIAVSSDSEWRCLCEAMGAPQLIDDRRFGDVPSRYKNQEELDAIIEKWTSKRDHHEVMETLQATGVPAGPVLKGPELFSDPHIKERGTFCEVIFPDGRRRQLPGLTAKLSRSSTPVRMPPPRLGEHNQFILGELLALGPGEIRDLEKEGVIGTAPTFEIDPEELY
ncbi:MAG: CaiB/BaiF CoA transferase family protein [Dehalococcoidia bacterium]